MHFFDIHNIVFQILGYPLSYLEFFGVLSGLIAVWLSAKAHIMSWPAGIVNVTLSFFLYFQVQLYPDMFLQIFFFVTNVIGWWRWANPKPGEEDRKQELRVSFMDRKQFIMVCLISAAGTVAVGAAAARLHEWLPWIFALPSAFPYADSFILVMSIVTTFFMIQKKVECWIIWIMIDVLATFLYFLKDIKFYGIMYAVFTVMASFGLWNWIREYKLWKEAAETR